MPAPSFTQLQAAYRERAASTTSSGFESGTMVVISSISFPSVELQKIAAIQHYEERLLCMLLLLNSTDLRIVYVTSLPIDPAIIDYYLEWLDDPVSARSRLELVSLGDGEPRALSAKLLEHPEAMDRIRVLASSDAKGSFIMPFNVTSLERSLAESLQMPLYGPVPDLVTLGSKSGSRRSAETAGVPILPGAQDLSSVKEVVQALNDLRTRQPRARSAVIKLNNGFSGQGNAIVALDNLATSLEETPVVFCAETESWATYRTKIAAEGAVVEELVRVPGSHSPSVQLRIAPGGHCEIISTHDQILGGPDYQVYLGCMFPARADYRDLIQSYSLRVCELLERAGVIGLFGIDFVVVPDRDGWRGYLSEINLRMGGTTHPFFTARLLTGGGYDQDSGELIARGQAKCYVASDNFKSTAYIGLRPFEVIEAVERAGLAFDRASGTGATLHLLGALTHHGKLGAVCIANSLEEAQEMYEAVQRTLDELTAGGA
jgi:hypothetical protein